MMKVVGTLLHAVLSLAMVCLLQMGCGAPSEEARVKEFLKDTVALAEKKDVGALMERFEPGYSDFEGRDLAGTERLIREYLGRFRGIVIHLLGARVELAGQDRRTSVECEMSFSHGAAEVLRKLISYTGEYYRFRFELDKTGAGEWRFAFAEWQPVGLVDLFPESLKLLKELFPDIARMNP